MGASTTQPSLTILGGPMTGHQYVIEDGMDNVLIGSDPSCPFHLPLPGVSPIHARLWIDAAGVTVYDTNSPRGLYVNDDRVVGQSPLRNGDILWLGSPGDTDVVMIQCRVPPSRGAAAAQAPAPAPALDATTTLSDEGASVSFAAREAAELSEPEGFRIGESEPTAIIDSADVPSAFEVVPDEAPAGWKIADVPSEFVEPPTLAAPRPPAAPGALPAVPAFFEDETMADPAAPTLAMPPKTATAPPVEPTLVEPPKPAPPPPAPAAPRPTAEARPAAPTPPKPAAAAPAPVRKPAAPRPAAAAAPVVSAKAPAKKAGGGSGAKYAIAAVVGLLVIGGAAFLALPYLRPAASTPPATVAAVEPTPATAPPATAPPDSVPESTLAAAPPSPDPVEEAVTIVKQTPAPTPSPKTADLGKPTPAPLPSAGKATPAPTKTTAPAVDPQLQIAARVGDLLGQADAALAGNKYEAAAGIYDEVLKLDAQNARATTGKTAALAGAAAAKRTFVPGRTTVTSGKATKGGVSGFDSADVSVAKAPDYSGRIEFEASPRSVKPGDNYSIKVYLVNDGKKDFKIGSLTVGTLVNGARAAGGGGAAPTSSVNPQQRVLLQDVTGVWGLGVNAWLLEVVVTSNHNDTFKNTLSWR